MVLIKIDTLKGYVKNRIKHFYLFEQKYKDYDEWYKVSMKVLNDAVTNFPQCKSCRVEDCMLSMHVRNKWIFNEDVVKDAEFPYALCKPRRIWLKYYFDISEQR